jgi:hypothetical protein
MLPGISLHANLRFLFAPVLFCVAVLVLTACGSEAPTATPARPTATVEAVRPHPTRPPRPTPTEVVVFALDTPTPFDFNTGFEDDTPTPVLDFTDYATYQAPEGNWSLEYPSDWDVNVDVPNYQFSNAIGDAFVQETYSELDSTMASEDLAQLASEQFDANFENYIESDQVEQKDGSYRIDFKFDVSDGTGGDTIQWDAQAFVESHQKHLYMLMLATTQDAYLEGTYDAIIGHIIESYKVPSE